MSIKFLGHLLVLFLSVATVSAGAAGLDDADERLFQVQQALAMKGDPRAQYFLGEMHEQGLGTKQNIDEAFKWYAKAAEKGDSWSKRKLAHRAEIEADLRQEKAQEKAVKAQEPPTPYIGKPKKSDSASKNSAKAKKPEVVAQAQEISAEEEKALNEEKIKAAERAKRRAAVRAMILDRIRHPVGEPFE
jgi:TPR repeat protein